MGTLDNWILAQNDSFLQNHQMSVFLEISSTQLRPDRETKIYQQLISDWDENDRKIISAA